MPIDSPSASSAIPNSCPICQPTHARTSDIDASEWLLSADAHGAAHCAPSLPPRDACGRIHLQVPMLMLRRRGRRAHVPTPTLWHAHMRACMHTCTWTHEPAHGTLLGAENMAQDWGRQTCLSSSPLPNLPNVISPVRVHRPHESAVLHGTRACTCKR